MFAQMTRNPRTSPNRDELGRRRARPQGPARPEGAVEQHRPTGRESRRQIGALRRAFVDSDPSPLQDFVRYRYRDSNPGFRRERAAS